MQPTEIDSIITQAEAARDSGRLAEGLAMAEPAWQALGTDDAPARRRLGLVLLHLLYRSGALTKAVDLADHLLPLLRASGPTTELIDTLRMVSLCSADTNRFAMSLSCAQEAHRLSLDIGDAIRLSLSTNALGCFFERSGDPWQAERLMLESLSLARQAGDAFATRVALNNTGAALIGKFYLLRDAMPPEQAADSLRLARPFVEESVALARASGEVFFQVFALGNLSEILVHLGEAEPAALLLDESLTLARPLGFEAQVWRMGCTRGELLLLQQQPQAAWDQLAQVLQAAAQADQRTTHMRLHHAMWRAAAQLGRSADALHHLQAYLALERARAVTQLQAQSDLFITRMEAEQVRQEAQRHRARASALEADVRRDQLTGLGNRREMEVRWPELIRDARASGQALSVAMLDLDLFKPRPRGGRPGAGGAGRPAAGPHARHRPGGPHGRRRIPAGAARHRRRTRGRRLRAPAPACGQPRLGCAGARAAGDAEHRPDHITAGGRADAVAARRRGAVPRQGRRPQPAGADLGVCARPLRAYRPGGGPKGSGDCAASQAVTAQQATFCGSVAGSMRSSVSFTVWCTSK
jgi:tetratricopeptide (TPR) repeat protein